MLTKLKESMDLSQKQKLSKLLLGLRRNLWFKVQSRMFAQVHTQLRELFEEQDDMKAVV